MPPKHGGHTSKAGSKQPVQAPAPAKKPVKSDRKHKTPAEIVAGGGSLFPNLAKNRTRAQKKAEAQKTVIVEMSDIDEAFSSAPERDQGDDEKNLEEEARDLNEEVEIDQVSQKITGEGKGKGKSKGKAEIKEPKSKQTAKNESAGPCETCGLSKGPNKMAGETGIDKLLHKGVLNNRAEFHEMGVTAQRENTKEGRMEYLVDALPVWRVATEHWLHKVIPEQIEAWDQRVKHRETIDISDPDFPLMRVLRGDYRFMHKEDVDRGHRGFVDTGGATKMLRDLLDEVKQEALWIAQLSDNDYIFTDVPTGKDSPDMAIEYGFRNAADLIRAIFYQQANNRDKTYVPGRHDYHGTDIQFGGVMDKYLRNDGLQDPAEGLYDVGDETQQESGVVKPRIDPTTMFNVYFNQLSAITSKDLLHQMDYHNRRQLGTEIIEHCPHVFWGSVVRVFVILLLRPIDLSEALGNVEIETDSKDWCVMRIVKFLREYHQQNTHMSFIQVMRAFGTLANMLQNHNKVHGDGSNGDDGQDDERTRRPGESGRDATEEDDRDPNNDIRDEGDDGERSVIQVPSSIPDLSLEEDADSTRRSLNSTSGSGNAANVTTQGMPHHNSQQPTAEDSVHIDAIRNAHTGEQGTRTPGTKSVNAGNPPTDVRTTPIPANKASKCLDGRQETPTPGAQSWQEPPTQEDPLLYKPEIRNATMGPTKGKARQPSVVNTTTLKRTTDNALGYETGDETGDDGEFVRVRKRSRI